MGDKEQRRKTDVDSGREARSRDMRQGTEDRRQGTEISHKGDQGTYDV
jgi:hypothetical protein